MEMDLMEMDAHLRADAHVHTTAYYLARVYADLSWDAHCAFEGHDEQLGAELEAEADEAEARWDRFVADAGLGER